MAPNPVVSDVFDAIADGRRRELLGLLAGRRMAVNDLVDRLGWPQPMVSKQLRVLRQARLVRVEKQSRQKFYSIDAQPLKAVRDWANDFERFWELHLFNIKTRAESAARAGAEASNSRKGKSS
jgi:DNA-binding transcriptional ArsR family regulator